MAQKIDKYRSSVTLHNNSIARNPSQRDCTRLPDSSGERRHSPEKANSEIEKYMKGIAKATLSQSQRTNTGKNNLDAIRKLQNDIALARKGRK